MNCNANLNARQQTRVLTDRQKLDWDKVNYIRANFKEDHPVRGCKGMAKKFSVSTNTISKVVNGDTWEPRDYVDDVEPPKTRRKIMADYRKAIKSAKRIQSRLKELYPERDFEEDAIFNEHGYEMLKDLLRKK